MRGVMAWGMALGLSLMGFQAAADEGWPDYADGAASYTIKPSNLSTDSVLKFDLRIAALQGTSNAFTSNPIDFQMDTGSTGIVVEWSLLTDNQDLLVSDQRGWAFYNSTGLLATGYVVNASVTYVETLSGAPVVANVPILVVMEKFCLGTGANSANCENDRQNNITMMGVGFGRNTLGEDTAALPVYTMATNDAGNYGSLISGLDNAGQTSLSFNPFLHIAASDGNLHQGYIIQWDEKAGSTVKDQVSVVVGLTAGNTSGFAYSQLQPATDALGASSWSQAIMGVELTNPAGKPTGVMTGIFLPDTGVTDSFVHIDGADYKAYSFVNSEGGNQIYEGSTLLVQVIDAGDLVTLTYPVDNACKVDPPPAGCVRATPSNLLWVSNVNGQSYLNTGLNFYRNFHYMFDPQNGFVGVVPADGLNSDGIVFTPVVAASGQISFSDDMTTAMPVWLRASAASTPAIAAASGTTATFNGPLSGPGGLVLNGAGTVVLNGINTYSGATTVQSGSFSVTQALASPVTVDAGGTFSLSGTLTGNVTNAGMTTVTGTVDGDATNSGTFVQNGTVTGTLTTSGRLSGSGSIGNLVVAAGGTVATGNSVGTMTVSGDYLFGPGASREVEVGADGTVDLLTVGGVAMLAGGTVVVIPEADYVPVLGNSYVFLQADGGIAGRHDTLVGGLAEDYPFLATDIAYGRNDALLVVIRSGLSFEDAGMTPNARAVGAALDTFVPGSALDLPLTHLTTAGYASAAGQLSGEIYASALTALQNEADGVRDAIHARLGASFDDGAPAANGVGGAPVAGMTAWISGYGNWGNTFSTSNTASMSTSLGGTIGGLDAPIGDSGRLGLAVGFGSQRFKSSALNASGQAGSTSVALYGGGAFGAFKAIMGGSWTWHDLDVDRSVSLPGYAESHSVDYSATTGQVFGEIAYDLGFAPLEAFGGLAYVESATDGFSEGTGLAALSGGSGSQANTLTTLGFRFAKDFAVGGGVLRPHATLGWQHAFGEVDPTLGLAFTSNGAAFTITGAPVAEDVAVIGAGIDFAITDRASVSLGYNGRIGSAAASHAAYGALSLRF
ncbi:autotransporter domain-containing protein [Martelella endophytica]|nr:autotransporter domain-containing protein [Martelella endophytica]